MVPVQRAPTRRPRPGGTGSYCGPGPSGAGPDPEHGYTGLLRGKKAAVIYTSAVYGEGRGPAFGADFQSPFFEDWLRWAGISDVETIHFRPNLATQDPDSGRRAAMARAAEVGKSF